MRKKKKKVKKILKRFKIIGFIFPVIVGIVNGFIVVGIWFYLTQIALN